jgi:hypothetical protein
VEEILGELRRRAFGSLEDVLAFLQTQLANSGDELTVGKPNSGGSGRARV